MNDRASLPNNSTDNVSRWREWLRVGGYALVLCLVLIILLILSSDQAPQWIYQGF